MKKFSELPYERPDIAKLKEKSDELLKRFNEADSFEMQNEIMKEINKMRNHISTVSTIASVRHSIDTRDKKYDEENTFYDQNSPLLQEMTTDYYKALNNSKFKEQLKEKWGNLIFDIAHLEIKTFSKEIMDDLKKENELVTNYQKLTSGAKIMFKGEERNLSGMTPFMQDKDRTVRKEASNALFGFFTENEKEFDDIYDQLVKVRTSIAKKLGYDNFVQLAYDRLTRSDYGPKEVANYRKQIHEQVVPFATELRKRQAERIGVDKMKFYDESLKFSSGNATPKGEPKFIVQAAKNMYHEMSQETGEFIDMMLENELMDLETKKGKRPGGYCTFLPDYGVPFIFSNFNGTSHDVDVLTHEAGHAFQSYMSRHHELPEYQWPTLEACEIHSMSMEFFAWPWMESFFKEDTEKYKFSHLAESLLFLPYGVAVDEFQHFVYENPEATPKQRKEKWSEIEKKYLPHRDYDGIEHCENGGLWQKQLHIYCVPFYYIDYTLAQVCAFQFWKKSLDNRETAWEDYLRLCKAGGSKSFVDLVKHANLKSPFEDGCLASVMGEIRKWLDGVDDKKL